MALAYDLTDEAPASPIRRKRKQRPTLRPTRAVVEALIREASRLHGISFSDIAVDNRHRPTVRARWSVWLALRAAGYSAHGIAVVWGCNHTTILYAWRQVKRDRARLGECAA